MGQFKLFPIVLLVMSSVRVVVSAPNLTCYFGPAQNIDDLDPFLCTRVVANALQTIVQEPNGPRIDINTPRLAKLVALKIVNPELQLILGIDSLNVQTLLQKPDVYTQVATQLARLLVAVHVDGIDLAYEPEPSQNATQVLSQLFSRFQPIFTPLLLTTSLTVKDYYGPTAALAALKIDHVHVLPSAKPSITPELEERQVLAKIEPWLKTGFTSAQLSVGMKIGGTSWRQDSPTGRYVLALDGVSRPKICKTLLTPGWQSSPTNVTKPSAVLSAIHSADNQHVISFASVKGIPKLVQKVSARVGGVAVMDADLDDARNACGEGTWPVMKVIRESLKLPTLSKEGEKTKIRLKLNMETMTDLTIFRWLNDDTASRGKRQTGEDHTKDHVLTWPKRNKSLDVFNDRGHILRSKQPYVEVPDRRPDPPRHYGQLRHGSRKQRQKSSSEPELRSGILLPIPPDDILRTDESSRTDKNPTTTNIPPGLRAPSDQATVPDVALRNFDELPSRKGANKKIVSPKTSPNRRGARPRRSSLSEVPEGPILSDCGQVPKVVPVINQVVPPVVNQKPGQPFLQMDKTDFADDPIHNADHFELKEDQNKRVRRQASDPKSQGQGTKPGAGKQASRATPSSDSKTKRSQGKGQPRKRAPASNNDEPEPRCGGARPLGVPYPAIGYRPTAYRRYRRSLELEDSEPNAVLGESNLPITVGDDAADLDQNQSRPASPRAKRQSPNSQSKRRANLSGEGQARANGKVPTVPKPAPSKGKTGLGTGAKPIPAGPNQVAPKPVPATSKQSQLKDFFKPRTSPKRVRRRVFTRPQDSGNPHTGKLNPPQPRNGVAPRVKLPQPQPHPIKPAPRPRVTPYRRIVRQADVKASRPEGLEREKVHLRRKDLRDAEKLLSQRFRGRWGNNTNKGRRTKVRKPKSGPKLGKLGKKIRVPSPLPEALVPQPLAPAAPEVSTVTEEPVPEMQEPVPEMQEPVPEIQEPEQPEPEVEEPEDFPEFELRGGIRAPRGKVWPILPPAGKGRTRRSTEQINRPNNAVRPQAQSSKSGLLPHRFDPSPPHPMPKIEVLRQQQILPPSRLELGHNLYPEEGQRVPKPVQTHRVRRETHSKPKRWRTKAQQAKRNTANILNALREEIQPRNGTRPQAKPKKPPLRTRVQRRRANHRKRVKKAKAKAAAAAAQNTTQPTTTQPTTTQPTATQPTTVTPSTIAQTTVVTTTTTTTTTPSPTTSNTVATTAQLVRKRREVTSKPAKKATNLKNKSKKSKGTLRKLTVSPTKSPPSKKVPAPKPRSVPAAKTQTPVPVPKTQTTVPVAKNQNPVPLSKPNPVPAAKNENRVPTQRRKRSPEEPFGVIDDEGRKRRDTALASQPGRIKRQTITLNQPSNPVLTAKKPEPVSPAVQDAIRKDKQARRDKIRALMIRTPSPSQSIQKPKRVPISKRPSRTSLTNVKLTGLKKPIRPSLTGTGTSINTNTSTSSIPGSTTLPSTTASPTTLPGSQLQNGGQWLETGTETTTARWLWVPSLSVFPPPIAPTLTKEDFNAQPPVSFRVRNRSEKKRRRY